MRLLFHSNFWLLSPAHHKKRFRRPRKSKWSSGVIKKPPKKKSPALASPSSSSSSSSSSKASSDSSVEEGRAAATSSSESSDGERSFPKTSEIYRTKAPAASMSKRRYHETLDLYLAGRAHRQGMNWRHQNGPSGTAGTPQKMLNGIWLNKLGQYLQKRMWSKRLTLTPELHWLLLLDELYSHMETKHQLF